MTNPAYVTRAFLEQFAIDHAVAIDASEIVKSSLPLPDAFEDSETWARKLVVDWIKSEGHDGMVLESDLLPDVHTGGDWSHKRSYVVFSPDQINILPDITPVHMNAASAIQWMEGIECKTGLHV